MRRRLYRPKRRSQPMPAGPALLVVGVIFVGLVGIVVGLKMSEAKKKTKEDPYAWQREPWVVPPPPEDPAGPAPVGADDPEDEQGGESEDYPEPLEPTKPVKTETGGDTPDPPVEVVQEPEPPPPPEPEVPVDPNPFSGWTKEQIAAHRKKAMRSVRRACNAHLGARQTIIRVCGRCNAAGWVWEIVGARPLLRRVRVACPRCNGKKWRPDKKDFETARISSHLAKSDPGWVVRQWAIFQAWRQRPNLAKDYAIRPAGGCRKIVGIEVFGNTAMLEAEIRLLWGGIRVTVFIRWGCQDKEWLIIADPPIVPFKRCDYPGQPPPKPQQEKAQEEKQEEEEEEEGK